MPTNFYTNVQYNNNKIQLMGYSGNKRVMREVPTKPYLFLPTAEESKYRTLDGSPVKKRVFDSSYEAYQFRKEYEDVAGFPIYGMADHKYVWMYEHYNQCEYNADNIKICILDIEVSTKGGFSPPEQANNPITAITMQYKDITFVFGYHDFETDDPKIKYFKAADERELLQMFLRLWTSTAYMPDVVSGWYIDGYDIPYIINRLRKLFSEQYVKMLSPWKRVVERKTFSKHGKEEIVYDIHGISVLDYKQLYTKFVAPFKPQESYSLNHISFVELKQEKLDYSEYGNLQELFEQDHQKFIEYNILDCDLVWRMNEKLRLFNLIFHIAYRMGVNYQDALKTVVPWDVAIHNYLMDRCVVVPHKTDSGDSRPLPGGYVKPAASGMHEWVVSFDLTSLYPHLIMHYNIGPDTWRGYASTPIDVDDVVENGIPSEVSEYMHDNNLTLTASGNYYTKDKRSFLAQLMDDLFQERKEFKDQMNVLKQEKEKSGDDTLDSKIAMYDTFQHSIKILLNSAYGALGNKYFRWYNIKYAESITLSGQLTLKWAAKRVNEYMNKCLKTDGVDYIITADTDSIYIDMGEVVKKLSDDADKVEVLDRFCETMIQPFLNQIFDDLKEEMNAYQQAMYMKREAIADRGVFTTKKRYMLNVLDNEGVRFTDPYLKIMGIESVRSSTPTVCKDAIKEAVRMILQEDEEALQRHVTKFREEFMQMSFEEIGFPRSVNGMGKYFDRNTLYKKATPIAVRGSLLYNNQLKELGLSNNYLHIMEGEKIKFCYLRMPNPLGENIIAFPEKVPVEFDLHSYIDYDTQFNKAFLMPIANICHYIGWSPVKINRFVYKKKTY